MKSLKNYLDECKEKTGSDYATAKALGFDRATLSQIRSRGTMKDENAVKVAELLGIEPGEVLLAAAMARSQGAVRTAWENVSKKAGMAASITLAVLIMGTVFSTGYESVQFDSLYIMRS